MLVPYQYNLHNSQCYDDLGQADVVAESVAIQEVVRTYDCSQYECISTEEAEVSVRLMYGEPVHSKST